jgi:hypothetical protein
MIPAATIFTFLVGAVLAWGFRVWILLPIILLTLFSTMAFEMSAGTGFFAAIGLGFLVGLMPQFGYAFGLFTRGVLVAQRFPRKASSGVFAKRRSL